MQTNTVLDQVWRLTKDIEQATAVSEWEKKRPRSPAQAAHAVPDRGSCRPRRCRSSARFNASISRSPGMPASRRTNSQPSSGVDALRARLLVSADRASLSRFSASRARRQSARRACEGHRLRAGMARSRRGCRKWPDEDLHCLGRFRHSAAVDPQRASFTLHTHRATIRAMSSWVRHLLSGAFVRFFRQPVYSAPASGNVPAVSFRCCFRMR